MGDLAKKFYKHLEDARLSERVMAIFQRRLEDGAFDFESIVDEMHRLADMPVLAAQWGVQLDGTGEEFALIKNEAEWFVQHECEALQAAKATVLWGPLLYAASGHELTVATTNYDRAVEVAARRCGVEICDGFSTEGNGEYFKWRGFDVNQGITLLKLHGSTDWYRKDGARAGIENVFKLRHPMPLFGGVTVNLADEKFGHCIILPSREKRVVEVPFSVVSQESVARASGADIAIFVGTSMRDPHIAELCGRCCGRMPTFVVGRSRPHPTPGGAEFIPQVASVFLASTLPRVLRSSDVAGAVTALRRAKPSETGVLDALMAAVSSMDSVSERCKSIDRLIDAQIMLDERTVSQLMSDQDSTIRLYALALIELVSDPAELLEQARSQASQESQEYRRDLEVVEQQISLMLSRQGAGVSGGEGVIVQ